MFALLGPDGAGRATTHHLDEAAQPAGRVGVITAGRLVEVAPPAQLGHHLRRAATVRWTEDGAPREVVTAIPGLGRCEAGGLAHPTHRRPAGEPLWVRAPVLQVGSVLLVDVGGCLSGRVGLVAGRRWFAVACAGAGVRVLDGAHRVVLLPADPFPVRAGRPAHDGGQRQHCCARSGRAPAHCAGCRTGHGEVSGTLRVAAGSPIMADRTAVADLAGTARSRMRTGVEAPGQTATAARWLVRSS